MDEVTRGLRRYVKEKGVNISKMARDTGIPYISLYRSLKDGNREIRGGELLKCCAFLEIDPMKFYEEKGGETHDPPLPDDLP